MASSAAGQGIGGAITPLAVWGGYWALAAVLFLFPNNRTRTSVSSAITGMSPGEPSGYSHFLTHFGNHFGSVGTQSAWLLAIASLVIGVGPSAGATPGSSFLPGACSRLLLDHRPGSRRHLHRSGTDPNTGPLVILFALAMVPAMEADTRVALRWRRGCAGTHCSPSAEVVALVVALVLSAAYPVAAQETTSMAMSGMAGMPARPLRRTPPARRRAPRVTEGPPGPGWT